MIKIGLLKTQNWPWENVIYSSFEKALLSDFKKRFIVCEIIDYPKDNDFLILL